MIHLKPDAIVHYANLIVQEYNEMGLKLTLRQLYYQFVHRKLSENGQKHYKRIGNVLTKARYNGTFPVNGLEDRGRSVAKGDFVRDDSVQGAMATAERWLRDTPEMACKRGRWFGQPKHVSVWVEKEALAGVFEPVCDALGVGWFACKGYPSVSALNSWLKHADSVEDVEERVVLYFGDHDPDGWEIPRSCERGIKKLICLDYEHVVDEYQNDYSERLSREEAVESAYFELAQAGDIPELTFKRVALNMDQIRQFNPPPFAAKMTSSRFKSYFKEHRTDKAWELDALDPQTLRALIEARVEREFDEDIHEKNEAIIATRRAEMLQLMRDPNWAPGVLA